MWWVGIAGMSAMIVCAIIVIKIELTLEDKKEKRRKKRR